MVISLIAAVSENGVIGIHNRLPWYLPADLANFRRITAGHKFIMGRKSYEAEDKLCSDAGNVIVTRNKNYKISEHDSVAPNLREAIELLNKEEEIFILGGAEIFEQSIDIADKLYITLVHGKFPGDAFFPEIDMSIWKVSRKTNHAADDENAYDYSFLEYVRR
jgi:dihydrofolate reductase